MGTAILLGAQGTLQLALGRDAKGAVLTNASSVSRTVMRKAISGTDQFIVTDNFSAEEAVPESIVAHSIRTIICIPLRRTRETR